MIERIRYDREGVRRSDTFEVLEESDRLLTARLLEGDVTYLIPKLDIVWRRALATPYDQDGGTIGVSPEEVSPM